MLDIDAAGAAFVVLGGTSLDVCHSYLILTLLTMPRPGQLAQQGADIATAKRVDEGGLSHAAVAEQLEFNTPQRLLVASVPLVVVKTSRAPTHHRAHSSSHQLFHVRVIFVRQHRLHIIT